MADSVGNVPGITTPFLASAVAPMQTVVELVQQPPMALLLASLLTATVIGRGGNGALLLATDYGTLALNTALALAPGTSINLRVQPGTPATVVLLNLNPATTASAAPAATGPGTIAPTATMPSGVATANPAPPATTAATASGSAADATDDALAAQLTLGTDVEATIVAAPTSNAANATYAVGTRLLLRIAVPEGDPMPPTRDDALPIAIAGTVAQSTADGQNKTALETSLGRLLLDQRLTLPEGTAVILTRLQAVAPAPSSAALDTGMTLGAKVVSPALASANPLPAGTLLTLRVAPLPAGAATAAAMTGTTVADTGSETVIESPIGTLALDRRLTLPPGTSLALERLTTMPPDQPSDPPLAQRAGWPVLDQTLAVLDRAAPELAARLRTDLAPSSGQQLAGTLLFLMSALNTGAWPGVKALTALESAGRRDLRTRLESDVGELRQLAEPKDGDWRLIVLPLLGDRAVIPVKLYLRRRASGGGSSDQGTRFVLDIDMSRLGSVELDGLVRQQRFDLVLRSHRAIAPNLRQGIAEVFHTALAANGLAGEITFTTASRFALTPAATMQTHIGVSA